MMKYTSNPYDVLGIDPSNVTKESLKKAYKDMARSTHPDTGGSNDLFILVQNSYKSIYREMRPIWKRSSNLTHAKERFNKGEFGDSTEVVLGTKELLKFEKGYNHEKFHQEFNEKRIKHEYDIVPQPIHENELYDIGPEIITKEANFHQEFTDHLDHFKNKKTDLIIYKEPQPLNCMYEAELNILDRDCIEDFSTRETTDFAKAYTKYNTIYQNITVPTQDLNRLTDRQFQMLTNERKSFTASNL
jgi:curved DNA-binding protein CbpA